MDTYSLLREIADSWVLLAMFLFFLGIAIWAFLPSQTGNRLDASLIPFRNDEAPQHRTTDRRSASNRKEKVDA